MQINEERFKGDKADFVNRLERDLQKRLNNEEGLGKASLEASKEETFQPVINAKSQKMRPRSSLEMSRGDQYRKEASVRLTKLQQEQEQMEEISFKPKICASSSISIIYFSFSITFILPSPSSITSSNSNKL
jgi:hypothetical protein